MSHASKDSPKVWIADLAAYTNGRLHGEWVELDGDDSENLEKLDAAIARLLETSPVEGAEEWAVHDYEGFAPLNLGEYPGRERLASIAAAINEHGPVFAGLLDHFGVDYVDTALSHMQEGYEGRHDSLEAWAEQYFEDSGMLSEVPESLRSYIDLERWARDAELGGDIFTIDADDGGVHVFHNV